MIAILKKELWVYFGNWSAWGIIAAFSFIGSLFLFFFDNNFNFFEIGSSSMQSYFVLVPWLFIFLIPALSMRSLAEEQQSGTLSWLFSQPVKVSEIVRGKFLAVWFIGIMCLFAAVGILASAVSSNQIMAYLSGVFMCFILYFGIEQLASYKLLGGVDYILQNFGFYYHYTAFTRGLVDTQDVAYFVLVMVLCLGLAAFFVERKK